MKEHVRTVDPVLLSRGLDACVVGVVFVDALAEDQPVVYVNPAFERLTGYSAAEALGRNCRFLQGGDRDQPARQELRRLLTDGVGGTVVFRNYRKDGFPFLNELTLTPVRDGTGTVTHFLGFQQDVTAREAPLQAAARAVQRLDDTLDRLPDPFISYDRNWTVTYVNDAAAAVFGHAPDEIIGQPLSVLSPEAHRLPVIQAAAQAVETGLTQRVSMYAASLGQEVDATAYATDDGVAVLFRDVTAERQAQRELLASQERFTKVFEASPLAITVTRVRDGHFVDVNPAFTRLSGYTRDDVIGRTSRDLHLWADTSERADAIDAMQARGQLLDQEIAFLLKSGEIRSGVLSMVPITLAGEACVVSLIRDVSEEQRAQHSAREMAAELQRTLDQSPDMIVSIDEEGRFVRVSAACERLLGYPPEAMAGQPFVDFVHPLDRERSLHAAAHPETLQQGDAPFQNRYIDRNGSVVWMEWSSVQVLNGLLYAVARDVTARRAATEDQAFLAAIVRASTDAIIGLALDGTVRSWNAGAERMYGYPAEQMIGHRITEIIPPELQGEEERLLALAAQGVYTPATETVRLSRSGTRIPVQLSVAPIFDHAGAVVGMSKIAQDISGRREAERQILRLNTRLQRQLDHLNGLREIDLAITSSLDLSITLGLVLDKVRMQVEAEAVTVLLLDPHALTLNYAVTRGFRGMSLHGPAVRLGGALAGQVALTRQPVVLNDLSGVAWAPDWQQLLDREGLTAYAALPLVAKGKVQGVMEVLRQQAFESSSDWLETLQTLAGQAAIAVDNAQLFIELERGNLELGLAYQETIEGWARALDLRDKETEGHSRRVTELTVRLCRQLGVPAAELVHVQRGALLHDIGKMGIADAVLLKPGPLTPEERLEMQRHPGYAVDLLAPIQFLRPAMDIPHHHHEKWDGTGYPEGLRGAAIPLTARAFAVVDVFDALTNDRPYRPAWPRARVLAYLEEQAGSHFDPAIVRAFLEMLAAESS